jgi:SAM-dependent methyltransferase
MKDGHLEPDPKAYLRRDLRRIRDRWNQRAADWDATLTDSACHLDADGSYSYFLEILEAELELGCGTGLVATAIHTFGNQTHGIDISPLMIDQAVKKSIPNTVFYIGDCFALPFKNGRFDIVLSRGVLLSHYGTKQSPELLKEVWRVLKPGGLVLMDFLLRTNQTCSGHTPIGKTLFDPLDIETLLARHSFERITISRREGTRAQVVKGFRSLD